MDFPCFNFNRYSSLEVKGLAYEIIYEDHNVIHVLWDEVAAILYNAAFVAGGVFYLTLNNIVESVTKILRYYLGNIDFEMKGILLMFYVNHLTEKKLWKY